MLLCAAAYVSHTVGRPGVPPCGCEPDIASKEQRRSIAAGDISATGARVDRPFQRDYRKRLRLAYDCDCNGTGDGVRVGNSMVKPILDVIESWTGVAVTGCPWRAFFDPFVSRVLALSGAYEHGHMAWAAPDPSHRLVMGVEYYQRQCASIQSEQHRLEDEARARARKHG